MSVSMAESAYFPITITRLHNSLSLERAAEHYNLVIAPLEIPLRSSPGDAS